MSCIEPDKNDLEMEMFQLAAGIVNATLDLAVATNGPCVHHIEPGLVRKALVNLRYAARNLGVDVN